jgi:ribosomal protein S18 acetylase RimI-like enzyme
VLIRSANGADITRIAALVRLYWELESIQGFNESRIESLLRGLLAAPEHGACWVAETAGSIVGYLIAVYMFSLEHGGFMAEIDEFFVTAAGRSAGVGSSLMEIAERDISALGMRRVQLQLAVDNGRARAFYQGRGFSPRAGYELLDKALRGSLL